MLHNISFSQIIYVNKNATGNFTGNSWEHAYTTIQHGISCTASGHDVWVANGTYYENLVVPNNIRLYGGFKGTETSLGQRNIQLNATVIDGSNVGRVVFCQGDNTVIDGFTIKNGKLAETGSTVDRAGAGILVLQADCTIRNNIITDNYAGWGAGIFVESTCNVLIEHNLIKNNHGAVCAGGIEVTQESGNTIIRHNTIVNNIGFGLEIPKKDGLILGDFHSNIVYDSKFNHHERYPEEPVGLDVWGLARACTDYSFIGEIWYTDQAWGSPYDFNNIYGDAFRLEPGFLDYANQNFYLAENSPCRGAGKNNSDMGAYTYYSWIIISGSTQFWSNNNSISSATIEIIGDNFISETTTDINGYFEFPYLWYDKSYKLAASKTEKTDIGLFDIVTYDAAITAQKAIGLKELSAYQEIAADVNKDSQITMFDAALIAQYAVGLTNVQQSYVGEWEFEPAIIDLGVINSDKLNNIFNGILIGNVHGEWAPPGTLNKFSPVHIEYKHNGQIQLEKNKVIVPLFVEPNNNILSSDIEIAYNADELNFFQINKTKLSDNFNLVCFNEQGKLRIGMYSVNPLIQGGNLINIAFQIKSPGQANTTLDLKKFLINKKTNMYGKININSQNLQAYKYELHQNYPNPFNASTTIQFSMLKSGNCSLKIYNLSGKEVRTLMDGYVEPGIHKITWDGGDNKGNNVAAGFYSYKLLSGNFSANKKLIFLK